MESNSIIDSQRSFDRFISRYERKFNLQDPKDWDFLLKPFQTTSGVPVTIELAVRLVAVFACANAAASNLATLPKHIIQDKGDRKTSLSNHPQSYLFKTEMAPGEMTSAVFFRELIFNKYVYGNGYAEIIRKNAIPVAYLILHPKDVEPLRDKDQILYYQVRKKSGGTRNVDQQNMIHYKDYLFGKDKATSRISLASESIGVGIAARKFAAKFYGSGTHLGGWISMPEDELEEEQIEEIIANIQTRYGGVENMGSWLIAEAGVELHELKSPFTDTKHIEQAKQIALEVASMYSTPPHKIGLLDDATYSNIESQDKDWYKNALRPEIVLLEQEFNRKIFKESEKGNTYLKVEVKGFLRADIKERTDHYQSMLERGVYSINEVRALEDMNPIPGGDVHYIMANMMELGEKEIIDNNNKKKLNGSVV